MKQYFAFLLILALWATRAQAQHTYDTVQVMSYNVLNYGFDATNSCPALITADKHGWLRTILNYHTPDILGLEKMTASPATFTTDTVIQQVLDSVCNGCYGHTPFTNVSGYSKENMLYFKTAKFGWLSTTTIYSADNNISDINLHTLFYKSPSLALTHDTILLHIILAHLESGSNSAAQRAAEITGAMQWLNTHITSPGNSIFMGDFNTQSSTESCYQQITAGGNPNTTFYDVAGHPGNWNSQPDSFALYLTQSTRTTDPGDCGATGGMDDWFDHQLATEPVLQGTAGISYVPGSFYVIGQDGLHVNKALIASPVNTSAPANIISALYNMSEHLPVTMRLAINTAPVTGVPGVQNDEPTFSYNNPVTNHLQIFAQGMADVANRPCVAQLFDMSGRRLSTHILSPGADNYINLAPMAAGVYLLVISQNNHPVFTGKVVKCAF